MPVDLSVICSERKFSYQSEIDVVWTYPWLTWDCRENQRFDEPWKAQAQQNVKCVRSDWVAKAHWAEALSGYDNRRDGFRDGSSSGEKSQAHHSIWESRSVRSSTRETSMRNTHQHSLRWRRRNMKCNRSIRRNWRRWRCRSLWIVASRERCTRAWTLWANVWSNTSCLSRLQFSKGLSHNAQPRQSLRVVHSTRQRRRSSRLMNFHGWRAAWTQRLLDTLHDGAAFELLWKTFPTSPPSFRCCTCLERGNISFPRSKRLRK